MKPSRIAVVGCGIAGASVALLLQRQGHQVTLFEQAPVLEPVGAGIMLQPLGQKVLSEMGLLHQVIGRAEPIHELHAIQRSGRTMIRMPFAASRTGMHAYGVHRADIFEVLTRQLQATDVEIVLDARIETTVENDGKVEIGYGLGRLRGGFDYAIIANGSKSLFRQKQGFRTKEHQYNYAAIWCNGHTSSIKSQLLQVVHGTTKLLGILPVGMGRASFFWGVAQRNYEPLTARPISDWKAEVVEFFPDAEEVIESISDWSQTRYGTYRRGSVTPLFDRKHLFLGDAAHPMSPHLGQGLNFALLDAYRFAKSVEQSRDWEAACRIFANAQRNHLRYYRFVTALLTPFFQSDSLWKGAFRDFTLPWLHRTPIIRHQMALTMTGLKRGFLGGEMRIDS